MNPPDTFHNVCGKFASNNQEKTISSKLKTCYKHYFGCKAGYQYKKWAPHIGFTVCYSRNTVLLYKWYGLSQPTMSLLLLHDR